MAPHATTCIMTHLLSSSDSCFFALFGGALLKLLSYASSQPLWRLLVGTFAILCQFSSLLRCNFTLYSSRSIFSSSSSIIFTMRFRPCNVALLKRFVPISAKGDPLCVGLVSLSIVSLCSLAICRQETLRYEFAPLGSSVLSCSHSMAAAATRF